MGLRVVQDHMDRSIQKDNLDLLVLPVHKEVLKELEWQEEWELIKLLLKT